jgi:D-glycero-D-manno-heptose 1,7-bisphosphate phosphatase
MLVLTGKGKKTQREGNLPDGTRVFADLADAVKHLVSEPARALP